MYTVSDTIRAAVTRMCGSPWGRSFFAATVTTAPAGRKEISPRGEPGHGSAWPFYTLRVRCSQKWIFKWHSSLPSPVYAMEIITIRAISSQWKQPTVMVYTPITYSPHSMQEKPTCLTSIATWLWNTELNRFNRLSLLNKDILVCMHGGHTQKGLWGQALHKHFIF